MIDHEKSKVVCNKELYDLNCQPIEVSLLRPAPSSGLKFIIFVETLILLANLILT